MNRLSQPLTQLREERDHVAIQINLLNNAESPDAARLTALERKLAALELSISRWRPPDA